MKSYYNNHNSLKNSLKMKQSGFSLIELLIASTLGLFIIGGVITSFVGTKDSEKMRSTVSEMDANARTALEILRKNISLAGYSSMRNIQGFNKPFYSKVDEDDEFTKGSLNRSCSDGIKMSSDDDMTPSSDQYTRDSNERTGRSDVLTAVVLADNPCLAGKKSCSGSLSNISSKAMVYIDCAGGGSDRDAQTVSCSTDKDNGMTVPAQAKLFSTFYLGSGNDVKKRTLYCRGNRGGTVPLVEDIEYLQFLYGVRRTNDSTEYMKADDVESGSLWSNVISVRVGLLMRSSKKNVLKKASTKTHYLLLDRNVEVDDLYRLYRVYSTTISLPNRNKGNVI